MLNFLKPKAQDNLPSLPPLVKEPLKWLFVAHFSDGTSIKQTQEDKCTTRDDGTGSAFTDVLAREDELVGFELVRTDGKASAFVDLPTGNFMINGVAFNAHNQNFNPKRYKLKLIYFRETRVEKEAKGVVQNDGSVKQSDIGTPRHFTNRYFIGWQTTTPKGNVQQTIAVG